LDYGPGRRTCRDSAIPSDERVRFGTHGGDQNVVVECRSPKAENGSEYFVDSPKLLMSQMPDQLAQSPGVYGTYLFNENTGGFPFDLGFRSE